MNHYGRFLLVCALICGRPEVRCFNDPPVNGESVLAAPSETRLLVCQEVTATSQREQSSAILCLLEEPEPCLSDDLRLERTPFVSGGQQSRVSQLITSCCGGAPPPSLENPESPPFNTDISRCSTQRGVLLSGSTRVGLTSDLDAATAPPGARYHSHSWSHSWRPKGPHV